MASVSRPLDDFKITQYVMPFVVDMAIARSYNHAVMDFLQGLNPQQQQAVTVGTGPVLVLAGPGSGKTRVLTMRIAYLIGAMGVRPYHILAVTFTNKAAHEMENRVVDLLGDAARGVTLGTFHATCAKILRREAEHLPFKSNFVIFDADDQEKLVKQAIGDLNLDEKRYRPQGIHASISNAKNELLLPDQYPVQTYRDEVVKRVYKRYQDLLLANNAVDFDDLLLWTAFLLEQKPDVREKYARRYEHVLVDEFQDTNLAQYTLVKHLCSHHRNVFCVGDQDQSIYGWRGADYRNVLRFEQDYPDTQVILLEQNYRSTQLILDTAMAVIDQNPHRTKKKLFTERGSGEKVTLHESYDDRGEAAFVLDMIASLVKRGQAKLGDFSVMYRTNAQSRVLEEAFLHAGIPYKLVGAQRFYGRREIKDALAYMRLAYNPSDEISLTRAINTPPRGIGDKTVIGLRTQAQKARLAPGLLLIELAKNPDSTHHEAFAGRAGTVLTNFGKMLDGWQALAAEASPLKLLDQILTDVDYHAYIDDNTEEGHDRWDNVMEFRRLATEFEGRSLSEFLEEVALVSDQDTLEAGANVPTLLTLHAAKGLEFPVVFIVGLNDGTLPHARSFEDADAMEEERRLLYVGITRAKDRLYLLHAQNRSQYGYAEPVEPSRFIEDIPNQLLELSTPGRSVSRWLSASSSNGLRDRTTREGRGAPADRWTSSPAPAPVQSKYRPGAKVIHPSWGDGMVLNSKIQDGDEVLDIFFENVGLKRVIASMAKLEVKS
jgi:DNA helicase-2/ATP-dependent DNA helicase PcrA